MVFLIFSSIIFISSDLLSKRIRTCLPSKCSSCSESLHFPPGVKIAQLIINTYELNTRMIPIIQNFLSPHGTSRCSLTVSVLSGVPNCFILVVNTMRLRLLRAGVAHFSSFSSWHPTDTWLLRLILSVRNGTATCPGSCYIFTRGDISQFSTGLRSGLIITIEPNLL